jgi:hypothetical protein
MSICHAHGSIGTVAAVVEEQTGKLVTLHSLSFVGAVRSRSSRSHGHLPPAVSLWTVGTAAVLRIRCPVPLLSSVCCWQHVRHVCCCFVGSEFGCLFR